MFLPIAPDAFAGQTSQEDIQDDWSGVSNQRRRKRLQNRINQRAYRNRIRQAKLAKMFGPDEVPSHQHGAGLAASFQGHHSTPNAPRHSPKFYPEGLDDPVVREVLFFGTVAHLSLYSLRTSSGLDTQSRDALWPTFSSCLPRHDSSCSSSPLSKVWFQRLLAVPIMRHAIVVGTCVDLELLRGRQYGLTMLSSTNELIRQIRRQLSQVRSTPYVSPSERKDEGRFEDGSRKVTGGNVSIDVDLDDDLLFAVMHLAKATGTRNMSLPSDTLQLHSERSKVLFRPPVFLQRLQYLHLWGLSDTPSPSSEASLHLSKLELLVVLKGGLQRVKALGFAEALHLFDIIESAKRLEKPRFELPKSSIEFLEEKMPALREAAALEAQQTQLGVEINRLLPVKSPLREIFGDIQIFCSWISSLARLGSVGHIQSGNRDSSSSAQMVSSEDVIMLRNLIEYRLLAYSPGVSNSVESVMWTSAMIFAHGVIFPLPHPAAASLKILIRRLRKALSNHLASRRPELRSFDSPPCRERDPATRILIWAATMGVMATSDSPVEAHERAFFLDSLRCYVGWSASDISSWTQLKSVLEAYLWADWACDAGGLAIWEMLS